MSNPADVCGPTVLVADDSALIRALLCHALQLRGYHVVEASNGQDAVDMCQRVLPDLVLMDVQMPVMDGLAACSALRRLPPTQRIPVLIMTATAPEPRLIESIRSSGASDFVFKPFELRVLYERVRRLCPAKAA